MGRKRIQAGRAKRNAVAVRYDDEEIDLVEQAARKEDEDIAPFVRRASVALARAIVGEEGRVSAIGDAVDE